MATSTLASRTLAVDEAVRDEASTLIAQAHDHQLGNVVITLDDGREIRLPPRLSRFVANIVESIAAAGALTTTSLPEELTTTVAAEALGISRPTLMKMIERGELPAKKVGSHTRLRRDDVFALRVARQSARAGAVRDLRAMGESFN